MKSKMSFFDPTLLKKNISRFSPAWAILLLAMLLAFPMSLMRSLSNLQLIYENDILQHLRACERGGVAFALFAALIFAALVFKYLHTARAAYMMHAFPMTRRCMFLTNLVSGLLFYLVPALLTALCCLGVLWGRGISGFDGPVWSMFLRWTLQYLFFYGLAVFTMHISGRTVIAVLSYGALNFVFCLIPLLVLILMKSYFYGYDYQVPEGIRRLAPAAALLSEEGDLLGLTAVYAGVGAALTVLAWVHYRVRQVERAGDAMVYPWARIAFRLIFTLCCALGLGWVLAAFFNLVTSGSTAFLPYALLGCFLGWFGATMMLERTVKVFRNGKSWLGFAAFAAVLILFTVCLKYDLLGFQRRVPETAGVESVDLWTEYGRNGESDRITLTQGPQIEKVRELHAGALEGRESAELNESLFYGNYAMETIHIRYTMTDGSTLQRCYELTEDRDIRTVAEFYADPETAAAWYDKNLPRTIRSAMLFRDETVDAYGNEAYTQSSWECRDLSALRAALIADAAAGRLPIFTSFYLDRDNEDKRSYYQLELYAVGDNSWYVYTIPGTAAETLALFGVR